MFFGGNAQFIVECMVPNLLHVIPVGDDTALDWVSQGQNPAL